jgi:hypothetical protein
MKKIFLLIVLLFSISAFAISQSTQIPSENLKQFPEMCSGYLANSPIQPAPEIIKNSDKQLLNGVTYTYVGSFDGLSGPNWSTNPPCYTGREAAALLFGGVPGDYAISINSNSTDPNTITFTAMMVSYGGPGWFEYPQDYKVDVPPVGYADPGGGGTATSAYVWDWPYNQSINYVWRINPPVPISDWALGLGILLIMAATLIRFRRF